MNYESLLNKEADRNQKKKIIHPRFNSDVLKITAVVTMLLDHVGSLLIDHETQALLYVIFRCIGRLSFPLFAFLLVQGFHHTRNVRNYALRLFAFAVFSEPFYDYAFYGTFFTLTYQNIMWTLLLGLLVISAIKLNGDSTIATIGFTFLGCLVAVFLNPDYSLYGVLMIVFFYFDAYDRAGRIVSIIILNAFMGGIQFLGSFALFFTEMYKDEKRRLPKYVFYAFYPVHLGILILIRYLLK